MKYTHLVLALLLCILTSYAQNTIKGKVVETSNATIDFAEIQLIQENSEFTKQTFTAENGEFVFNDIPSGHFLLTIIYLGQKTYEQKLSIQQDIDLGIVTVDNKQQLNEIIITSEKKLVDRKVDRLIYNNSNSISSQGMSALEALSNTPLVKVVDDKVSITGKNTVTIMIDDRILYLSGDALTNYLKTLRSDDIDKIEVITAPPAKYEAAGNSGLINIVMKKNKTMGLYGTASTSYSYNNFNIYNGNGSINFQNSKWNIQLKANTSDATYQSKNIFTFANTQQYYNTNSLNHGRYKNTSSDVTINYQLTEKAIIGASYNYTHAKGDSKADANTIYASMPHQIVDSIITANTNSLSTNQYNTLTLFFEQKLDTVGGKLALGVNYFGNRPDNRSNVFDKNTFNEVQNHLYFENSLRYNVWNTNLDLNYTFSWVEVELGAKYTNYDNKSSANYYTIIEQEHNFDGTKSNTFDYNENNYATYLSLSKKLSDKFQIKAGLRFEHTEIKGNLLNTSANFTKSYGKWFPSAYVSYNPNETNSFSVNYTKRINRPYSEMLNPFRYYNNTYSYTSGNPMLEPSISNNLELNYIYNSNLSFSLRYSKLANSFDQFTTFEDGIMSTVYYNMLNTEMYGLNTSYNDKVVAWWETSTGFESYYANSYYTKGAIQIPQNGLTFNYYSQNTFNLNKTKSIKLVLNWYHQLPSKEDNTRYSDYKTLSTGVKLSLLETKLTINTILSDIFNTGKSHGTMYNTSNIQTYDNSWNSRRLTISASYTFGNTKKQKQIKEASFEDKDRSK